MLRLAGAIWCAYGMLLLVYAWSRTDTFWLVAYGPPITCLAYGLGLIGRARYIVWVGWSFVGVLMASAAINDLLREPSFLAVIAVQMVLATFTTAIRERLRDDIPAHEFSDARGSLEIHFFRLVICAWAIEEDDAAELTALLHLQRAGSNEKREMLDFLDGLPNVLQYAFNGTPVTELVARFRRRAERVERNLIRRLGVRLQLEWLEPEYAEALGSCDASVFVRRYPDLEDVP